MFNRNADNQACLQSGQFIATMPLRQGLKIAYVQEAAWRSRLTSTEKFEQLTLKLAKGVQP